jgi:hypothetical protein
VKEGLLAGLVLDRCLDLVKVGGVAHIVLLVEFEVVHIAAAVVVVIFAVDAAAAAACIERHDEGLGIVATEQGTRENAGEA